MIVKNEVEYVKRLIYSLEHHISGFCVCDTGSTDDTVHRMAKYFDDIGVSGVFVDHAWKDFSHNKNLCLRYGKLKLRHACKYWLVLDADQVWIAQSNKSLLEMNLDLDAYRIREINAGTQHTNIRLFKAEHHWYYTGVIHERLTINHQVTIGDLADSFYTLHNSRMKRSWQRDIEMLQAEFKRNPSNHRVIFHLAKVQHIVDPAAAVEMYLLRISLEEEPGEEEVFWSKYSLALLTESAYSEEKSNLKLLQALRRSGLIQTDHVTFEDMQLAYDMASTELPYRYEPWLRRASLFWFHRRDAQSCYKFSVRGLSAGPETERTLFAHNLTLYSLHHLSCVCGTVILGKGGIPLQSCETIVRDLSELPIRSELENAMLLEAQNTMA